MSTPTKVLVIGAGWSGLVAARTYLQINKLLDRPLDLIIIDESDGPGGVWSPSRLYPGLIANSPVGLYEYSHMTMVDDERQMYEILPGKGVQSYLEAYARKFNFYSKIRFQTKVTKARRRNGPNSGWTIETSKGDILECDKLIIASGLYSNPRIPSIPSSTYTGISIHHHDLGSRNEALRADPSITNIVVVGGCKSAIEACNVFLPTFNPKSHHRISWVIRPSVQGVPIIVQDVHQAGNIIAVNQTRLFAAISPSIFQTSGFGYTVFHSGKYFLGTLIISWIWRLMTFMLQRNAKFDSSKNGRKIKPQGNSAFYDLNSVSLLPSDSPFLKYLHADDDDILKVHRATPIKLHDKHMTILSADGTTTTVPCDAVIWCTGWLPAMDFFSESDKKDLGLPTLLPTEEAATSMSNDFTIKADILSNPKPASYYVSHANPLAATAEQRILKLFPALIPPARPGYPPPYTPYRLYRQCLPLSSIPSNPSSPSQAWDRSIIFSGLVSNAQTAICSELTSLWSIAYLESLLPASSLPTTRADAEEDVELCLAFARRRYGVKGGKDPEIVLEVQSFLDLLMRDLGVGRWRKRIEQGIFDEVDGSVDVGQSGGGGYQENGSKAENAKDNIITSDGDSRVGGGISWYANLKAWITEYTTPYFSRDYENAIQEFLVNNGHLKREEKTL